MKSLAAFMVVVLVEVNLVVADSRQRNVLGNEMDICSDDPLTGWYRDGYCNTDDKDAGVHTVCATMTKEFLEYTKSKGNDLSTASAHFPGLKEGNRWCLCALRWEEARKANHAPLIHLAATNAKATKFIPLEVMKKYSDQGQK